MYKPTTLKDIARALHFSLSTVSRALRDDHEISVETKQIIKDYAKKANYQSNPNALSLKYKRSYSIGIVVPDVANSFFSQAIAGIESIAGVKGYHTILTQTYDSSEREMINVNYLANRSVDGLLISMSSGTSDYQFLKTKYDDGLPIVFFDRVVDEIATFKVKSDNFQAAYHATESLIKAGGKKVALLANAHHLSITNERLSGYLKALTDYNLPYRPELIKICDRGGNDYQEVEDAVTALLNLDDQPDALFMISDSVTIACVRALKKLKINSQDILVAGFSNSNVVDLFDPSLSFVRQKAFEMGRVAVEMLFKMIETKRPFTEFETKIIDTELFNIYENRQPLI